MPHGLVFCTAQRLQAPPLGLNFGHELQDSLFFRLELQEELHAVPSGILANHHALYQPVNQLPQSHWIQEANISFRLGLAQPRAKLGIGQGRLHVTSRAWLVRVKGKLARGPESGEDEHFSIGADDALVHQEALLHDVPPAEEKYWTASHHAQHQPFRQLFQGILLEHFFPRQSALAEQRLLEAFPDCRLLEVEDEGLPCRRHVHFEQHGVCILEVALVAKVDRDGGNRRVYPDHIPIDDGRQLALSELSELGAGRRNPLPLFLRPALLVQQKATAPEEASPGGLHNLGTLPSALVRFVGSDGSQELGDEDARQELTHMRGQRNCGPLRCQIVSSPKDPPDESGDSNLSANPPGLDTHGHSLRLPPHHGIDIGEHDDRCPDHFGQRVLGRREKSEKRPQATLTGTQTQRTPTSLDSAGY